MSQHHAGTPSELGEIFDVAESTGQREPARLDEGWESLDAAAPSTAETEPRWLSTGTPSRPLLGKLPLARVVPQDIHSIMDYVDGGGVLAGAFVSDCPKARAASLLIGGSGIVTSALTDYRLSLAKLVPIETHEVIDYVFGLSAISAPFLFGYRKTAPLVAATHIAIGLGTILASLFTDYRSYRGVGRARATGSR